MADKIIAIKVPEDKVAIALQGMLAKHPNNETDENGDPLWTNAQWVSEIVRRFIKNEVRRGLQILKDAEDKIAADDDIAQTVS